MTIVGNTMPVAKRAHAYRHPEDSIERVHIAAYYLRPSDRDESVNWPTTIETLLQSLRQFHHREFQSLSMVEYTIHPVPIVGESTAYYRQFNHDIGYFDRVMGLLPKTKSRGFHSTIVFADWGMTDNDGQGGDTYLRKRQRQDIDVSDILQLHGCRGCYLGKGRGQGFISEEAWKHPEIEGSDIVVYHEGLGHALNMPHSRSRHGVMGRGQYQNIYLSDSAVDKGILRHMITD